MDAYNDRLMPAGEVLRCLGGVSRETLRRMLKAEQFPPPVLGKADRRRRYWRASDVQAYLASRGSCEPRVVARSGISKVRP